MPKIKDGRFSSYDDNRPGGLRFADDGSQPDPIAIVKLRVQAAGFEPVAVQGVKSVQSVAVAGLVTVILELKNPLGYDEQGHTPVEVSGWFADGPVIINTNDTSSPSPSGSPGGSLTLAIELLDNAALPPTVAVGDHLTITVYKVLEQQLF